MTAGQQWIRTLGWCLLWSGLYGGVARWGMWWAFGTAGALTVASSLLVRRTCSLLFRPRQPGMVRPPVRIRRVILEEEL